MEGATKKMAEESLIHRMHEPLRINVLIWQMIFIRVSLKGDTVPVLSK